MIFEDLFGFLPNCSTRVLVFYFPGLKGGGTNLPLSLGPSLYRYRCTLGAQPVTHPKNCQRPVAHAQLFQPKIYRGHQTTPTMWNLLTLHPTPRPWRGGDKLKLFPKKEDPEKVTYLQNALKKFKKKMIFEDLFGFPPNWRTRVLVFLFSWC